MMSGSDISPVFLLIFRFGRFLTIFVIFSAKNAKFNVILRVCSLKTVIFPIYFFEGNILRPKPASYDERII